MRQARFVVAALAAVLLPPAAGSTELSFRAADEAWGVAFRHHHGGSGTRYMVETMVGGVVVFDADGDGDDDLYFVDGAPLPGYQGEPTGSRLLRNDGGRFVDVTERSGLGVEFYGSGGAAGDVDGDGDVDLYITAFGVNRLFRNEGDGTFSDVTAEAGVGETRWSASAGFADTDRDGDLDLYVANYLEFSLENHTTCNGADGTTESYCHPDVYGGLEDTFYRNDGTGRFEDVTKEAGFGQVTGRGLGLVFGDYSNNGWLDLYVANDLSGNFFYSNRGDGTFEDLSMLSGTAFGDRAQPEAGMGVDADDVDGDLDLDLVVTNFEFESNGLYLNTGTGLFVDGRFRTRFAAPSVKMLGFGIDLADFDNDGDVDAVVANGHDLDNTELFKPRSRYRQPNQVFENVGDGVFELVDAGLDTVRASRGLATGDLDLDGDLDVVVVNVDDWSETWENTSPPRSWLALTFVDSGTPDGIGTRAIVTTGETAQLRESRTASSYLSQGSLALHIGLGHAESVDRIEVRWPDGARRTMHRLPASRRVRIRR